METNIEIMKKAPEMTLVLMICYLCHDCEKCPVNRAGDKRPERRDCIRKLREWMNNKKDEDFWRWLL